MADPLTPEDLAPRPLAPANRWALPPLPLRAEARNLAPRPSDPFLPNEQEVGRLSRDLGRNVRGHGYSDALLNALELIAAMAPIPGVKRGSGGPKRGAGTARETPGAGAEARGLSERGGLPGGAAELPAPSGPEHPYTPIPGQPATVKIPGYAEVEARPIPQIEAATRDYFRRIGRDYERPSAMPAFDPERAKRIAAAFEAMKHDPENPQVRRAYDAMIDETLAQYKALKDQGFEFRFNEPGKDPYAASPALGYLDMRDRGRLSVFPTLEGFGSIEQIRDNPLLRDSGEKFAGRPALMNDIFRVVHDAYGHNGPGNPFFRAPGEERAWGHHSIMYGPEARPAMTSETRGQNSWVNFGPYAERNKGASGADTIYADQKIGLMPEWTWKEGRPPTVPGIILDREYAAGGQVNSPIQADPPSGSQWLDSLSRRREYRNLADQPSSPWHPMVPDEDAYTPTINPLKEQPWRALPTAMWDGGNESQRPALPPFSTTVVPAAWDATVTRSKSK